MIVIARNYGQLGNRLILASHLIAAAREYNVALFNPSFVEYASYFPSTQNDLWCRYTRHLSTNDQGLGPVGRPVLPAYWQRKSLYHSVYLLGRTLAHLRLHRYPLNVIRLGHEGDCDVTTNEFRCQAQSIRPLLCSGWLFDAKHLLVKHAEAIRDYFQIIPKHQDAVETLVSGIRSKSELVVGVHLRLGDYSKFRGGRYFYPVHRYVAAMHRIRRQFQGRSISFLVCSNVNLDREDFGDLDVHFGTGHLVEDMYSFAKCDHLVGPPSSYTGWASFMGGVPLHRMTSSQEGFEDFANVPVPTINNSLAPA